MAKIEDRAWRCAMPGQALLDVQAGVFKTRYRGRKFVKNPFDVVLYMQLIGRLAPRSVIEIGAREGGSALWLHDIASAHGVDVQVVSLDLKPPPPVDGARVSFIKGDVLDLAASLTDDLLAALPRPWLVTEDSAHTYDGCLAALTFFDSCLQLGDYIVIEDGVVEFLPDARYDRLENGPNRAVADFLRKRGEDYEIDVDLCDFYGYNVTYCPNAWLKRA